MMKFSKKASMQLSINAIVILVLAMAILGLGLGIVKMVRERASDLNIDVDLSETADSTKRIANIQDTFELRANKPNDMAVSFYNTENLCETEGAKVFIDCDTNLEGQEVTFSILQSATKVDPGTADKLSMRVKPVLPTTAVEGSDIKGSYACDFQIYCGDDGAATPTLNIIEHKSVIIDVIA